MGLSIGRSGDTGAIRPWPRPLSGRRADDLEQDEQDDQDDEHRAADQGDPADIPGDVAILLGGLRGEPAACPSAAPGARGASRRWLRPRRVRPPAGAACPAALAGHDRGLRARRRGPNSASDRAPAGATTGAAGCRPAGLTAGSVGAGPAESSRAHAWPSASVGSSASDSAAVRRRQRIAPGPARLGGVPDSATLTLALVVALLRLPGRAWRSSGGGSRPPRPPRPDHPGRGRRRASRASSRPTSAGSSTAQADLVDLGRRTERLEVEGRRAFQRIGLVRFNPFEDTGGNQSFALALLDAEEDGIVHLEPPFPRQYPDLCQGGGRGPARGGPVRRGDRGTRPGPRRDGRSRWRSVAVLRAPAAAQPSR